MKTFLRLKDFSVSASIFPALVLTLGAPSTSFAPLFSFREQQAPSRIIEIKHLHGEDKLIKAKHNTTGLSKSTRCKLFLKSNALCQFHEYC